MPLLSRERKFCLYRWVKSNKLTGKILNEGCIQAKYIILESDVLKFMNVHRIEDINPDTVDTLEQSNRQVIKEIKTCSARVTQLQISLMDQMDNNRRENLAPQIETISSAQIQLNQKVNQLSLDIQEIKKLLIKNNEHEHIPSVPDVPVIHQSKIVDPLKKFGGL